MSYFSLHNHTDFSNALLGFSDSTNRVPNLIQYAYDIGLNGVCITDHEGISAHIQALNYYNKMQKDRPFVLGLGNEIYLMKEFEDEANKEQNNTYPYYHFILIALDTEGHRQIRELSTRAWNRAWKQGRTFRRPTYYNDLLEIISHNRGHVVGLSACLGSRIDRALLEEDLDTAITEVETLKVIFGEENFFLEIQPAKDSTTDQFAVNDRLFDLAERTSTPIVVTTDSHYLKKEDALIHKVFLNSQDGDREVDDFYATAYMMDKEELTGYLSKQFKPDIISKMLSTSNEIMARIGSYDLYHNPIIPEVPLKFIPNFKASHRFSEYYEKYEAFGYYANIKDDKKLEYFFYQIESALVEKVINKGKEIEPYIARLDEEWKELKIISEQLGTKMPCYYQTMSYIIDLIWEAGSLAMPARGSAAGFLTCYLLEVTQIDPVPLGDYFPSWRHLNHQRGVELPD